MAKKIRLSNYFKPSIYVRSFKDVNISQLKLQGIKLFISDLDNTLVPHYSRLPNKDVLKFISKIQELNMEFALMSNNVVNRVKPFVKKANIKYWRASANKPFKKVAKSLMDEVGASPSETIIMGDQVIMDILVANRLKCESILVQPIVSTDYKMTEFKKFLENSIYLRLERKNILVRGRYSHGNIAIKFDIL